jgi:protein pelota
MIVEWEDKNTVRIRVEDEYDLLTLFKIVGEGDVVYGYDFRTIKISEGKKERVKVWIKIEVENVKFSEYEDALRINGRILDASEIVSGKYHTFDVRIGSELYIQKKIWSKYELSELEKAQKKTKEIYIVSIDDSEICLASIFRNKVNIIEDLRFSVPKEDPERDSVFIEKISRVIKIINEREPELLVIVGPIFYPDIFDKECEKKLNKEIKRLKFKVSRGGKFGIYEFLRRKEYLDVIKEQEIAQVNKKIAEFLEALISGLAVFGLENVREYVYMQNVEFILISYDYFKKLKEEGRSSEILDLIKLAEECGSRVYFVFKTNENFETIDRFGIVAKVRYKID